MSCLAIKVKETHDTVLGIQFAGLENPLKYPTPLIQ